MPGTIPNMRSTAKIPGFGRKRNRFLASAGSVVGRVLGGTRRQRAQVNELDVMKSVIGDLPAGTAARDAQADVHNTVYPGEHLSV